ncbi:hypothetical protein CRG98_043721 [Punica granatum]|uniref:NB-ARC domain-containing protein n=1 Tax=Punica granatum TaxID=22663 RepID=A0A2I0HW20_PUNGR|nr:hypothetical protein CRG98_043721 [Punica granatum]
MVVRAVYEHVRIKHHFDRRAWVSVPANFIKNEVLRDLLVQLSPSGLKLDFTNSAKEEEELLGEELTKLLSGPGHYLIIMDDVKARDNAWKALTRYLHGTGGNRILINTGEVDPSTTLWAKTFDLGPLPREVSLRAALCSNSTSPGSSNSSIETLFWCCPRLSLQLKACLLYMFLFPRGFEISAVSDRDESRHAVARSPFQPAAPSIGPTHWALLKSAQISFQACLLSSARSHNGGPTHWAFPKPAQTPFHFQALTRCSYIDI